TQVCERLNSFAPAATAGFQTESSLEISTPVAKADTAVYSCPPSAGSCGAPGTPLFPFCRKFRSVPKLLTSSSVIRSIPTDPGGHRAGSVEGTESGLLGSGGGDAMISPGARPGC